MPFNADKSMSLAEAVGLITDGDLVAMTGMGTQQAPMAVVRELIRQERKQLGLVCLVGGIGVDWLAAAGVIDRLICCAVSMENFGMCQHYRREVEAGRVRVEEISEWAVLARLAAGAQRLPFMPIRGMVGTDLITVNPDTIRMVDDPFGGPPVVACRALSPDVAVLHAHRADRRGNVQFDPGPRFGDLSLMAKAAGKAIVTVEEIVDTAELRKHPERSLLPAFAVDAVVEVPYGAHPTSMRGRYSYDGELHRIWVQTAKDAVARDEFLKRYVREPADQSAYLAAVNSDSAAFNWSRA